MKKLMKFLIIMLLTILLPAAVSGKTVPAQAAEAIKLNITSLRLEEGESKTLSIKNTAAKQKKISWKSNRTNVAKVSENGKVTAVAAGSTTIKCTVELNSGEKTTLSCSVTVTTPKGGVYLNKKSTTIAPRQKYTLTLKNIDHSTVSKIQWKSGKTSIVDVDKKGVITGVKEGSAEVKCTIYYKNGKKKSLVCYVTVREESKTPIKESSKDPLKSQMEVHYLDMGQNDATLIKCDGKVMLIDAAGNADGTKLQLYLKKQGIERIDYLVATHAHEDHIGGIDVIISKFDVAKFYMPSFQVTTATYRDVIDAAEYKRLEISNPTPGTTFTLGDAKVMLIAPQEEYEDCNNTSLWIYITHGETSFLFTGDAEEEAEEDIIAWAKKKEISLNCDVYQVGHHGSKTSSSEKLMAYITPENAVISCGTGNEYGHPHAQTLNMLRTKGIKTYRTDEQGTILAVSDGINVTFNMSPSSSWKAGEQSKADTEPDKTPSITPIPDADTEITYVLNKNTKKFHYPTCSSVEKISLNNREDTTKSREEITAAGYKSCGICHP